MNTPDMNDFLQSEAVLEHFPLFVSAGAPTTVYLAGPISGCSYGEATDWRDAVIADLATAGIKGLSPMRAKEYLSHMQDLDKNCVEYGEINVLSSPRGIMTRDHFDCTRCDVLLVHFGEATKVSVGTVMEVAWAFTHQTPIVCVMPPGNVHEHAVVSQAIDYRVNTLEEAVHIVKAILS